MPRHLLALVNRSSDRAFCNNLYLAFVFVMDSLSDTRDVRKGWRSSEAYDLPMSAFHGVAETLCNEDA